jgi:hypothetical protein
LVGTLAGVASFVHGQLVVSRSAVRTIARRQVSIVVEWVAMPTAVVPAVDRLLAFIICSSHHLVNIRSETPLIHEMMASTHLPEIPPPL